MGGTADQHVFILGGELKGLEVTEILEKSGLQVSCFARAAECLDQLRSGRCDLLITDLRAAQIDDMALMQQAKRLVPWLPILIVSDQGDVPMAVKAIKAGAVDFIQRPLDKENFAKAVRSILSATRATAEIGLGDLLTWSEARVLALVIKGKSNREIAEMLHRSIKTIEAHRRHIMRKLGVNNVVDLVKRVATLRLATVKAGRRPSQTIGDSEHGGPWTR